MNNLHGTRCDRCLDQHKHITLFVELANAGTNAPIAKSYDDAKAVRAKVEDLVNEGRDVIIVSHSTEVCLHVNL